MSGLHNPSSPMSPRSQWRGNSLGGTIPNTLPPLEENHSQKMFSPGVVIEAPLRGSPLPGPRSSRRIASLDDIDIMRMRSSSSFGWYDESTLTETEDLVTPFMQIDNWRQINQNQSGWQQNTFPVGAIPEYSASPTAPTKPAEVEFEQLNDPTVSTKTFSSGPHGAPVQFAVNIGAFRVISGGGGHAQYQVVLTRNGNTWKRWKRYSDFKMLAEYAKLSDLKTTVERWAEVTNTQRWFRCLEANYLRTKCFFLEQFMAQLLFDLPSPSLLLTFVQASENEFTPATPVPLQEVSLRRS